MKDFRLKNGQTLRIATAAIKLGEGKPLSVEGLTPDIEVAVSPEDEQAYFQNPYEDLSSSELASDGDTNVVAGSTNETVAHRINEAELVRMLREGQNPDDDANPPPPAEAVKPVIHDPALARALDLLKGLAVVRFRRS